MCADPSPLHARVHFSSLTVRAIYEEETETVKVDRHRDKEDKEELRRQHGKFCSLLKILFYFYD